MQTHDQEMAEVFRNDPQYALDLAHELLLDGKREEFDEAIRQMKIAFKDEIDQAKREGYQWS